MGGTAETVELGEAPEPDLAFGPVGLESTFERYAEDGQGDDEDIGSEHDDDEDESEIEIEDEDDDASEDEDEDSPAYGAIPGVRIMPSSERRSPSPTAVPLRSCLKKQKQEEGDPVVPLVTNSDAEGSADDDGDDDDDAEVELDQEVEVEVEIEEYMMAGLLSGVADEKRKRQEAEEMDEVDWQWRTLPFLLPTRGRSDWPPFLPRHLVNGASIESHDPLVELGGFLRNALFDHGRGRKRKGRKFGATKVRSGSSTPSSPRSVDGLLTPPVDESDKVHLYTGEYGFSRRTSVVGHLQTVGLSKRVRFPGCPEVTGDVALCVSCDDGDGTRPHYRGLTLRPTTLYSRSILRGRAPNTTAPRSNPLAKRKRRARCPRGVVAASPIQTKSCLPMRTASLPNLSAWVPSSRPMTITTSSSSARPKFRNLPCR